LITQSEANYLINLNKQRVEESKIQFPFHGAKLSIPIESCDKKCMFIFDINNTSNTQIKLTYQTRNNESIILIRIDINGSHRNPFVSSTPLPQYKPYNGKQILETHIHYYTEGYKDSWAIPLADIMPDLKHEYEILNYFYSVCSIIKPPVLEYGLHI